MWREKMINAVTSAEDPFDVIVIGGGATGLGIAVDAASRGYSVVLLERDDFAKGTSSRSTKLAHGGVRYLAQGNIRLVLEALRERGIMRQNAPALVRDLPFIVPAYKWWEIPFYFIGLKLYDLMSGERSLGRSSFLSAKKVKAYLPSIRKKGLKGGIVYYDGQFDDSRMAVSLAKTAERQGGLVLNYAEVIKINKDEESDLFEVGFIDRISKKAISISAKTVFNATGVFVDEILTLEREHSRPLIAPSRGAHIVVDARFLNSQHALMIPGTSDGRILFVIPWHNKALIGTTDAPVEDAHREPQPSIEEINFILETARGYLTPAPGADDILSVFAGLRPLAAPRESHQKTKEISRGHHVLVSQHQMITIIGGKWTTYRKMAEDAIDQAISIGRLPARECKTASLPIWESDLDRKTGLGRSVDLAEVESKDENDNNRLIRGYPWTQEDVLYMIREEYAVTIEDILSRRMRLLLLDAAAAQQVAPAIGKILEDELGAEMYDKIIDLKTFKNLVKNYRWNGQDF